MAYWLGRGAFVFGCGKEGNTFSLLLIVLSDRVKNLSAEILSNSKWHKADDQSSVSSLWMKQQIMALVVNKSWSQMHFVPNAVQRGAPTDSSLGVSCTQIGFH